MKFTSTNLLLGLVIMLGGGAIAQAESPDPVTDYYWQNARAADTRLDPNVSGVRYQFTARTFWHSITRDGIISSTDTVVQTMYFTDGTLDSAILAGEGENDHDPPDLAHPSVFNMEIQPHLYPNDTGGVDLAIGFQTDTARLDQPDGLAVIDRYQYHLRSLYLAYPHLEDYRRFSRCYRFVRVDDYLFPDSVWEVATRLGIFFSESYRMETGITDILVQPAAETAEP